ncbi:hypothetical protein ACKFKG_13950 [Phormidesmis sp. 146-35]
MQIAQSLLEWQALSDGHSTTIDLGDLFQSWRCPGLRLNPIPTTRSLLNSVRSVDQE